MSMFSLFSGKPSAVGSAAAEPYSAIDTAAARKAERLGKRELLYAVVRECMTRAGVLSASYRFKVLSLDARGRQYLIMVDLSNRFVCDAARWPEIEMAISQGARSRHDIDVSAVYWRANDAASSAAGRVGPAVPAPPRPPLPLRARPQDAGADAFKDTEVADPALRPASPLSATQYGDLA